MRSTWASHCGSRRLTSKCGLGGAEARVREQPQAAGWGVGGAEPTALGPYWQQASGLRQGLPLSPALQGPPCHRACPHGMGGGFELQAHSAFAAPRRP